MSSTSLLGLINARKNFEEHEILTNINSIFKKKKRKGFKIPSPGQSVVLLLSGGLDSIGLWFMLLNKYKLNVYPLYCYLENGENMKQRGAIAYFASLMSERFPRLYHEPTMTIMPPGFSFKDSRMDVKSSMSLVVSNLYRAQFGGIRAAIINNPTRIFDYTSQAISLVLKLKYTEKIDINTIFMGYIPEDGKATREPTLSVLRTMNLALSLILGDYHYQLMAPIDKEGDFFFKKSDLLKYCIKNNVPMQYAWSCIEKEKIHCGVCTSCRMRREAFKLSGYGDKTRYALGIKDLPSFIRKAIKRTSLQIGRLTSQTRSLANNIHLNSDSRLQINPKIEWDTVDEMVYRFHRITGKLDCLNETGTLIWQTMDKTPLITLKNLIKTISHTYKKNKSIQLREDVRSFIIEAIKEKYILLSIEMKTS
jgi:7-cyano-7-deazaguanine synthase in queuosine biosynthesis